MRKEVTMMDSNLPTLEMNEWEKNLGWKETVAKHELPTSKNLNNLLQIQINSAHKNNCLQ